MSIFIHNASFMMERERETAFLEWLSGELSTLDVRGSRLTSMREAGGVDSRHAEAQTVAWQCEFDTIEKAREWSAEVFSTLATRFEEKFGPETMVFTSIFETVDI